MCVFFVRLQRFVIVRRAVDASFLLCVGVCALIHRVLLGFTGFYRVSTWIHWILLGFIGCFQVFKNTIDFCFSNLRLNQCVPGFKLVGPVFTEFLEVLPDFSVFNQQYRATLHITEFSRISTVLLMSSSLLRHGNRFPWHFLGFLPSFTEFCARVATVSGFL